MKKLSDLKRMGGREVEIALLIVAMGLALFGLAIAAAWFIARKEQRIEARHEKAYQFIKVRKCERIGFAGKNPEAYYQCGNHMLLYSEIVVIANPSK